MAQKDEERKPYVYTPHTYDPFSKSDNLTSAEGKASTANDTYTNWVNNGFNFSQADAHKAATDQYNAWLNNGFSYDFNQDALYQQYKDKYIKQGKMAMQDTMGQAAAITGGYGNSYAATVGNQAYQASLENLNDVIPELYQMAYNMHQDKGANYLNQIGLLDKERAYEYGLWSDKAGRLDSDRTYLQSVADSLYGKEYGAWDADRTYSQTEHHNSENMRYQDARDAVLDDQWLKNYELSKRQVDMAEANITGKYTTQDGKDVQVGSTEPASTGESGSNDKIIKNLQGYTTSQGQADYLADLKNKGIISEPEALALLDEHGVVDLVDRSWEMIDDGGINWFGAGIDADAKVSDGNKTYTLAELRKELKKTMSTKEANDWIKKLEKKLGI